MLRSRNTLVLLAITLMLSSLSMISQEISEPTIMLYEESMGTIAVHRRLKAKSSTSPTDRPSSSGRGVPALLIIGVVIVVLGICICCCCYRREISEECCPNTSCCLATEIEEILCCPCISIRRCCSRLSCRKYPS